MTNSKYQTPSVEIIKCEMIHALMEVSEPKPATGGGPGLAPKREDVF